MFELVFFSTNQTKVAHFRYLGSNAGVKIKSFKEANYYASYHEPKIDDRTELLNQSYLSALHQWKLRERKPDDDTSTFFFEDTSVRIDALSEIQEIPGVNVKYWMRSMTFEKLDAILKEHRNNRKVTVRSDIVMHLPGRWKELLGIAEDFVWVYGETNGTISEVEPVITPNPVYPWLDDKTFNRWFIPDGAHTSISAISLDDANRGDFRRKAFDKIAVVLRKLKLLGSNPATTASQLELPQVPTSPSIFLVCGPTCAGKTTTASWLGDAFSLPHIEASDFMYKAFWERQGLRSKIKIGDFAQLALQTQPDIVAKPIAEYINEKQYKAVVITGFRSVSEIKVLRSALQNHYVELIYLDAPYDVRLQRAIKRNRDNVTPEKFASRNVQEEEMGLLNIRELAEAKIFNNDRRIEKVRARFRTRYPTTLRTQMEALRLRRFDPSRLEPYILMALYELLSDDIWCTTTEIASQLNSQFGLDKHKNNVSRYFNQEFHPLYEVRLRATSAQPVEYRVSATGASEAKLLKSQYQQFLKERERTPSNMSKSQQLSLTLSE
ncbi:non-canonical purine NTP pyrophosphatase [Herbaspirillum sp. NPDC087042]|uniref:non-canonical purine NTP pyrophosphatase n=1 Tax=Herbaspirillum sp. NPDC087042 TaxID=3364004 RepID=UPI003824255E